jgi:undecaprenyl diphosphate synthase
LGPDELTEAKLEELMCLADLPEPDLFIRTGGEQRISNFMLWQLAYTELYFTDVLWPEFGREELETAIASYRKRERRFGRTSEQLKGDAGA